MADEESRFIGELFPNAQERSSFHEERTGFDAAVLDNFGVLTDESRLDYHGHGPGYAAPELGAAEPRHELRGDRRRVQQTRQRSYASGHGGGGTSGLSPVDGPGLAHTNSLPANFDSSAMDFSRSIMDELPSRARQDQVAATLCRRPTRRSMRRLADNGGGGEGARRTDDVADDNNMPTMRRNGWSAAAGVNRTRSRRQPRLQRSYSQRRVSAFSLIKYHLEVKWKLFKESFSDVSYTVVPWRETMKKVEGRFGTGVVSYFLFLRWLVFLDLFLSLLVIGFIFIPQVSKADKTVTSGLQMTNSSRLFEDIQFGKGLLEDTELFYGVYTNTVLRSGIYSMPYAYMFTVFAVLLFSLMLLVWSMASAYRESYAQDSGNLYSYTNKSFGAWEFTITDESTARLKSISIKKDFEEELTYEKAIKAVWTRGKTLQAYSRRVLINSLILLMWVGAGTCIYFATAVSIESRNCMTSQSSFEVFASALAPSLTIGAFNLIFPTVFQELAFLELWRTPRTEVHATLLRTFAMRLSSLGVLMVSIYIEVNPCPAPLPTATVTSPNATNATLTLSTTAMATAASTTVLEAGRSCEDDCQSCWETVAGQEIYLLVIIDFFIILIATLIGETVWRVSADRSKLIKDKIGPPEFFIAKSVLELLYSQALLWLGVYFAPLICIICVLKFVFFFYTKQISLFFNLKPTDRPYRAARNSNLFQALLLMTLFLCLVGVGYGIVLIRPSHQCGPFRGKEHVYDIIPELVDMAPEWLETVLQFLGSAGFLAPLFILLVLLIYYFYARSRAQTGNILVLKNQLQLEGRDKQFLLRKVQQMQAAMAAGMAATYRDGSL